MRYTLLTESDRSHLEREYHFRALIVLLMALSFAGIVGIVFSFPIFIRVFLEQRPVLVGKEASVRNQDQTFLNMKKEFAADSSLVNTASSFLNNQDFSGAIDRIEALRGQIKIVSISGTRGTATSSNVVAPISVILRGVAPTRESLLDFKKRLESGLPRANVILPISELTKSINVSFSLNIENIMP